jgi:hypothetical protein
MKQLEMVNALFLSAAYPAACSPVCSMIFATFSLPRAADDGRFNQLRRFA